MKSKKVKLLQLFTLLYLNLANNNLKLNAVNSFIGGKRKLYRDVVLLTEDRNLVLKAMGRDMPVRSLPDFIRWAGLG